MSCTVVALPVLLAQVIVTFAASAIPLYEASKSNMYDIDNRTENNFNTYDNNCEDTHTITVDDIVEKTYETPFMDKDILLKTMEEHGIININETTEGTVNGTIDTFNLEFKKDSEDKPYMLKITCNKKDNADEKINDISSEYGMNVQEASYLSIVEKLKENNMEIEEETVEDDNTIVLTINLE